MRGRDSSSTLTSACTSSVVMASAATVRSACRRQPSGRTARSLRSATINRSAPSSCSPTSSTSTLTSVTNTKRGRPIPIGSGATAVTTGYGSPLFTNKGCWTEPLPGAATSTATGVGGRMGFVPGSSRQLHQRHQARNGRHPRILVPLLQGVEGHAAVRNAGILLRSLRLEWTGQHLRSRHQRRAARHRQHGVHARSATFLP